MVKLRNLIFPLKWENAVHAYPGQENYVESDNNYHIHDLTDKVNIQYFFQP